MIRGIDHVVVLVADLSAGTRRFETAGFSVVLGGRHPAWGTENALIPLADGAYIELLAARDPQLAARHRLWSRPDGSLRVGGEYGGFALETDDLEEDLVRAGELRMTAPQTGERQRPDGAVARWRSAWTDRPGFPFLIEDLTSRSLRVPAPADRFNSRLRLAGVIVAAGDLTASARLYGDLLALPPAPATGEQMVFDTGRGRIVLRAYGSAPPVPHPGLVAVFLAADEPPAADLTEAAGGARLRLVRRGDDSWILS